MAETGLNIDRTSTDIGLIMPTDNKQMLTRTINTVRLYLIVATLALLFLLSGIQNLPALSTFITLNKIFLPIILAASILVKKRVILLIMCAAFVLQGFYILMLILKTLPFLFTCSKSVTGALIFILLANVALTIYAIQQHDKIVDTEDSTWKKY
ncbi:hypothetical protein ACFL2A_05175 [Thermodesulfobacteriota bacterium]